MNEVYNYILSDLKIKYADHVVVAVSGGPDSMALLHLLLRVKKALNITIVCAHVNHNVRKASNKEQEFVKNYCLANDVIFETTTFDDYGKDNFHVEARDRRYEFFKKIIYKYRANILFTAHHADDLIETIMMRIIRGSSLKGYAGFKKLTNKNDYFIARPLIEVTKEQILNYCLTNDIKFVTDRSNEKTLYTRNRIRKYLLPILKEEEPNAHNKF